jgi:hypothetical protein
MAGENDSSIAVIALEIQQELPWQAQLVLLLPYHLELEESMNGISCELAELVEGGAGECAIGK